MLDWRTECKRLLAMAVVFVAAFWLPVLRVPAIRQAQTAHSCSGRASPSRLQNLEISIDVEAAEAIIRHMAK